MLAPRLTLPGWYAAWLLPPERSREGCVVFGFRDQEHRFVVEVGRRYVPLGDPAIEGARFVGPFHSPDSAQAALFAVNPATRTARGA